MDMTVGSSATSWKAAPLVALDLEGSGAQDRNDEAILEIGLVPITGGRPDLTAAYTTLINPGRPIPRRRWISPGLTNDALGHAPALEEVAPELIRRLNGKTVVGHNIGVDWRLLHRRCPAIRPAGLIDTLRLAHHLAHRLPGRTTGKSLTALLEHHHLTQTVTAQAPGSRPHRALWDTVGAALLLAALIDALPGTADLTLAELQQIAGLPDAVPQSSPHEQTSLLDL